MNQTDFIQNAIDGSIMHALLLSGAEGGGQFEFARRISAAFLFRTSDERAVERLENYPDYMELSGEVIKVDMVRELQSNIASQSFYSGRRAYVFRNASNMTVSAQNCLLKTLEEPPENTLIILTGNEDGLLQTIRSRCMIWRMGASCIERVRDGLIRKGYPEEKAELAALLADGLPEIAEEMCDSTYFSFREKAGAIFRDAMFGTVPYVAVANLLRTSAVFVSDLVFSPAENSSTDADEEKNAETQKKAARSNAPLFLDMFASVLRDALSRQENREGIINIDMGELSFDISRNFTKKDILDMIDKILEARRALVFNVNPTLAVDSVLTEIVRKREEIRKA